METKNSLDFDTTTKYKLKNTLQKLGRPKKITDFISYYWNDIYQMYIRGANRTTPCPALKNDFVIDANGDMYYCLNTLPIGNFRKDFNLSKIYFDKLNLNNREKMKIGVCKKCTSACGSYKAIAFDFKKYLWFRLTGKTWKSL